MDAIITSCWTHVTPKESDRFALKKNSENHVLRGFILLQVNQLNRDSERGSCCHEQQICSNQEYKLFTHVNVITCLRGNTGACTSGQGRGGKGEANLGLGEGEIKRPAVS